VIREKDLKFMLNNLKSSVFGDNYVRQRAVADPGGMGDAFFQKKRGGEVLILPPTIPVSAPASVVFVPPRSVCTKC
jgi:hypothetical protein